MNLRKWWWLLSFLLVEKCVAWLDDRPILESINGNLYLSNAKDKNITLKISGSGYVNINDIDLLHAVTAAQEATRLIERWKSGILDDVESTLQRLTAIIEGPNGLVRKINSIELTGDSSMNVPNVVKPSDTEGGTTAVSTAQVKALSNRLRRLESKVRTIILKLRTKECASDPCQNGGTCIDYYDGFQCHCPPEWQGSLCTIDVNECERLAGKPFGCQNNATCVNLPGSFKCICPTGWHGFHCSTQQSVCDQSNGAELCGNGICVKSNSPLGYNCICKAGWNHLGEGDPACRKDIDECISLRYPCSVDPLVKCHNVPGTFYCGTCPAGYTGDGFKCEDIDECLVNNGGCSTTPVVQCINTLSSRKCGSCPNGYEGDGVTCSYVGSCKINNGGCHSLATCREGPDSMTFCLCPSGYQGFGRGPKGCKPVADVCKSNPCMHGTCLGQGADSFICICNYGYTGPTCNVTLNRCFPNPCKNNGICRQTASGRQYCTTPKSSCGGYLENPTGYVEFPVGTGNTYPHGLSCAWVIRTNESMVLNVTFTRFDLEDVDNDDECTHDYLQIHDGRSAGSNIFGRYCGNKLPNNGTIISTDNSLYIWFRSDNAINSFGFAFNWTSIKPTCGGEITAEYGSISSPGFPGKYPTNKDCYWNINVTPGKRIALNFISVMFEEHPTCQNDYLEVNETTYARSNQLGLFCNHSKPAPITTSGPHAMIHFHSDGSGTDYGFHLSYLSVPGSPDCGGIFTSESGEIVSPGYHSDNYRTNTICEWEIRLPEGSHVSLKWLHFEIESSDNCMFDSVLVYEGPDMNSPLLGKYCGSALPPTMSVKSNRILIRFESDNTHVDRGFVIKYEVECGGIFTEPSGILQSPFHPNSYPASKDCKYLISQPPGKAIILTFDFLDVEEGHTFDNQTSVVRTECHFDKIEIRDGDSSNSSLLTTLCGTLHTIKNEPIYSTHNYMYIEFFTDASIHNLGFKANYTTIDTECGGILKTAPGLINIPGVTVRYKYPKNCTWVIRAPTDHAIQLTWLSFPIVKIVLSSTCYRTFIEVIEGYETGIPKSLGKFCEMIPPPQIMTSQGNDLTLSYQFGIEASTYDAKLNYQATYNFINATNNCGGYYFTETGSIRSPNYPDKYPNNKECIWVIGAKKNYMVTLNFMSFELENTSDCSYDYLEIRSGSQKNAPLLGKFCGSRIQDEITSMTNEIYIKFVSDGTNSKKGFKLNWRSTKTGCGGELRSSSGAIISPNYPENYYDLAECEWRIRVSAGNVVQITFVDLDIQYEDECSYDYLEIYDIGNGYEQKLNRFCGAVTPSVLLSKTNLLKLDFHTNVHTYARGFYLRYATGCHNKLSGFRGIIESPNFPENYENLSNCTWVISAPVGNKINITFSHFNIEDSDGLCKKNYIMIEEGDNNEPNTQLLKTCGAEENVLPLKISSSQRQVFVSFFSNNDVTAGGFRLEWFVDGCNKHLTKPNGEFTSPGYPNGKKLPYAYVDCQWLIEVSIDKSIEITFPKIENTISHDCLPDKYGAIEIYNGEDETAPILAHKLCYSNASLTYTSTGNRLYLKYSSDVSAASHGFKAIYRSVGIQCGGKFTSHSGVIHSPNYPNTYSDNQYCEWLISVDQYHAVNLTFTDIDTSYIDCSKDYVKIYDGNNKNAPLIAANCQHVTKLPYYVSSGNEMLVVMRSDNWYSVRRFRAHFNRTCGARIIVDGQGVLRASPTLHMTTQVNCSWILMAKDPGDKVTLSFSHIDLVQAEDCRFNHIDIYEGEGNKGPLIAQLCRNKIPTPFTSTGNALTVQFTSRRGQFIGDNFDAVYSIVNTACGGKYTSESGVLASPNYPLSYPDKADCTWIIGNSPGNRISLSFDEFDLLSSDNCDLDYVEIRDDNAMGKLHGVYCGKNIESITSSHSLWIRFKSAANTIGNPKGFKAEYNLLFGDELTGDYGEITSPMYPRTYRGVRIFSWRITVDFNYVIKVQFLDANFDNYAENCYSGLYIYDGINDEAPKLTEVCGNAVPTETITSTGNEMFIQMQNGNSLNNLGNWFHIKWIKIPRMTTTNIENQEIDVSSHSKFIYLTNKNGTYRFSSPGYPNGYQNNLKYSWTFVTPVGTHVSLRFLTMNIEESEDCLTDYVAIYKGEVTSFEGNNDDKLVKRVCLSNATMTTYAATNVMTVQFVTDSYKNKTGFFAVATKACGGIIEAPTGVIQLDTNSTRQRPYIYSCEWFVKVKPGKRINVKVVDNRIENNIPKTNDNSCRTNYLMLKNGESSHSPLLGVGKYCTGNITPTTQNTSSNYLYVKLSVSYAIVHFKLLFKELGHDCGGRFDLSKTEMKQVITSPNYPDIPTPHTECIWTLTSGGDHPLSIHFLDRFDLAFSENCEQEYVEVRDGGTDMSPLIGRYCKNVLPSSLNTKGNIMYVRYFTDIPEPSNGFKALITTDDCGSVERDPQGGVIHSPNFPKTYGIRDYYCSWWIIAPTPNRGIILQFDDYELSPYDNCPDNITIYEKSPGSFNNTKIGTYCGKTNPGVIEISSSEAIVIFLNKFDRYLPYVKKFRFNYTFSNETCGDTFNAMQGEFHTMGYPRLSPYKYCYWEIIVPEGYQVVVDIIDLDLDGRQYSKGVSFHHDRDSLTTITRIQESTQSMTVSSSSNFMSVRYASTGSNRGMKAKFTAKAPAPCGGVINNLEGTLTNPLSSPFNESSYYCKWIIQQPRDSEDNKKPSMTLAIEISGMIGHKEATSTCPFSLGYIMIKGDQPVAKVCGNLNMKRITVASSYPSQIIEAINATYLETVNFVMKYKWHNCGGILNGPSHIIQSPKNVSYPIYCVWKIANIDSDDSMLIKFTKLTLGSCNNNYVQIKGRTYRSPHIGKFCGNKKPKDIVSPSNEFTIEYFATQDQAEFEIRVDLSSTVCGGIVKGKHTEIRSPGFPQSYTNNTECIWEIVANNGYHVGLTFVERFNLETSKDCQNDYVEIYEWKEEIQNNTDHWYSLGRICGRIPPSTPFNSTTNRMGVKFVSNDKIEGEGFRAVWNQYCGGIYEVSTDPKYITSPNFPSKYPPRTVCNYTLIANDDKDIVVDFTNFNLEESSNGCEFDNLTTIFYRPGQLRATSTWCGTESPARKVSKKRMELIFKTDNLLGRSGFKFKYFINDCGGVITKPRIINPIRDEDRENYGHMSCIWTVKAPPKKSVLVRFEELEIIQELGSCKFSYVRLYEGNTTRPEFRKATFCGSLKTSLPVIQSFGDTMTIHYYASSYGKPNRFRAAVLFANGPEEGCGGSINVTDTTQFRTQRAETYEPSQDCHWIVSVPPDYTIQFVINEIDLKNTSFTDTYVNKLMACNSDYIEVRNGGPYSELIGHFCGSTIPPPITTTFNLLWIRFVSDGLNEGRGVRATLKAVRSPCGVTDLVINNDTQTLSSPGFLSGYPSDITCRWVIHTDPKSTMSRIKLQFTDFELADSEKCESEYLQVADLNNRKIVREGFGKELIIDGPSHSKYNGFTANGNPMSHYKYCGSELPHLYYSNFQDIEIIYKASASHQKKKGFKLEYSKASCSSLYTATQGRILHEDVTDCRITIEVPKNMTISLYFNKFFLHGRHNCSKGYMQVRDGDFDSPIVLTGCNYDSPNPVFSTGNRLSIYTHVSAEASSMANFYDLTYTSTPFGRGCGGQIYNYAGDFTSPMYPNPYRNSSTCIWEISVPKGLKISLMFSFFDIGSKATCHSDYLTIHEPPSNNDDDVNIITYCGGDVPAEFISQKNRIYVTYVTTINNSGAGWEAHFAAK